MKLGKLKSVKSPSRFRRWLSNVSGKLAGRYVHECHPAFMIFVEKNNLATASIWNDARTKRYREIMKILDSDAYRKYFYNAIDYKRGELKSIPVKWYVLVLDKIIYYLSKAYVFVFERELYEKIKSFETVSKGFVNLSKRMNEYIASTTSLQRLSRMETLGIISKETFKDDFDVIMNRVSPEVIEERNKKAQEEFSKKLKPVMATAELQRKIPDEVIKLLRKE